MKKTLIGLILLLNLTPPLQSADFQIIPYNINPRPDDLNLQLRTVLETNFAKLTPPLFSYTTKYLTCSNFTTNYANFMLPPQIFTDTLLRVAIRETIKDTSACFAPYDTRKHPAFPIFIFTPIRDDIYEKTYLLFTVKPTTKKQAVGFLIYNDLPNYNNEWPENKDVPINPVFNLMQENIDLVQFNTQKRTIRCCQRYAHLHHNQYYTLGFADALCRALQDQKKAYELKETCRAENWEKAKRIINEHIQRNIPSYLTQ